MPAPTRARALRQGGWRFTSSRIYRCKTYTHTHARAEMGLQHSVVGEILSIPTQGDVGSAKESLGRQ